MKKLNFWLLASLFVGALAFTACSSSNDDGGNPGGGGGEGGFTPTPVQPSTMKMAKLSGFVTNDYGTPISGVKVTSGNEVAYTNANGAFSLNSVNVVDKRAVVRFSSDNYADVVRSVEFKEGDVWDIQLVSEANNSFDPSAERTIDADWSSNSAKITIPANSLVDGNGNVATGTVYSKTTYLNPTDEGFSDQMPGGDLAAVRTDQSAAQLISYGMVSINIVDDNGKELQLKEGSEATLRFPAPEGMEAHATIPLWYFDEEKGLWIEEGVATKQSDGSYEGTIKHFSWHNLDYPESRATVAVEIVDQAGKAVPFQKVIVGQTNGFTDVNGKFSTFVPTNTSFVVTVKSADYANYSPEVKSENINISQAGSERKIKLTLPTVSNLSGAITNSGKGVLASVSLSYAGEVTKSVMTDIDGKYYMKLPFNYKGAATINIVTSDGTVYRRNIVLDGTDRAENFDVNPGTTETGTVTFTGSDIDLVVPMTITDVPAFVFGGVVIFGNEWAAMETNSSDTNYTSFSFENFSWSMYSDLKNVYIYSDQGATLGMELQGNKAKITVSGPATYSEYNRQSGDSKRGSGTLSGSFNYSILANIVEGASNVPSWVPQVSGSNPAYSYSVTNSSKLGDGWIFFYNNNETLDQYMALVNAAKATFGDPYYVDDDPEDTWSNTKSYVFVKGTQALQLLYSGNQTYEGWKPNPHSVLGGHHGWSEVPITIRAYSNVTVPFDDVVVGHKR